METIEVKKKRITVRLKNGEEETFQGTFFITDVPAKFLEIKKDDGKAIFNWDFVESFLIEDANP